MWLNYDSVGSGSQTEKSLIALQEACVTAAAAVVDHNGAKSAKSQWERGEGPSHLTQHLCFDG